jgi:hypothetical protein
MAKIEPKTFEIAEYSPAVLDMNTTFKVIKQIFSEYARGPAKHAVWVDMSGNKLKLHYHSYEMFLPSRIKQVEEESKNILDAAIRELKKEFKVRTGKALHLKEEKNLGNYTVEKVSLNERFYYKCWRFYDVSF